MSDCAIVTVITMYIFYNIAVPDATRFICNVLSKNAEISRFPDLITRSDRGVFFYVRNSFSVMDNSQD